MWKKITTYISLVSVALCIGWLGGRANLNRSRVSEGTGIYQDTFKSIEQLRGEVQSISAAVGEIGDTASRINESVESGQRGLEASLGGVESSIEGLKNIVTNSREAQSLAGGIGEDLASIGEASQGLADLFGIDDNVQGPVETGE